MTRAEAEARSRELNEGRDDGEPPWVAYEVEPGNWRPARARVPGLRDREPYKATTEAKPKPPQADDPRTAFERNVPPYGLGL